MRNDDSQTTRQHGRTTPNDRGAITIIVAVFLIVAMILLAFVIDRGRVYVARSQLQNAVDASALAGIQEACTGGDPVAAAEAYAVANGLDLANVDILDPVTVNGTTYLNVKANADVTEFFGPLIGQNASNVAAQATASRLCEITFQFVASEFIDFEGTDTIGEASFYGGLCFDGDGGTFEIVATGPNSATTDCQDPNLTQESDQIADIGNTNVTLYPGVKGVTLEGSFAKAYPVPGPDLANPNPALPTSAGTPDCDAVADTDYSGLVNCSYVEGPPNRGQSLDMPNGRTFSNTVIAERDIVLDNNATFSGPVLWSRTGNITLKGDLSAGSTVYAPNGVVTITGGGADIRGQIIAQGIRFSGGKTYAGGGFAVPVEGDFLLIQ